MSYPDYQEILARNRSFSSLFAFERASKTNLSTADETTLADTTLVSGNYFSALGVQTASGRLILPSDDVKGAAPVAVISSELSQRFGLVVGSIFKLNTTTFQVVGVLNPGHEGIERRARTDVWIPMWQIGAIDGEWMMASHGYVWVTTGGRLKDGVSKSQADAEILAISKQLEKEFHTFNYGRDIHVISLLKFRTLQDDSVKAMLILFSLGWFLFALAFANFFALTLVRLVNRRRELAVRLSLGASGADMGIWLLGELAVVSTGAIVCGFGLSHAFLSVLGRSARFSKMFQRAEVHMDLWTLAIVVVATVVCIVAVWLIALRTIRRTDLVSAIRETSTAPKRQRTLVFLFAMQFGIVLFILAVASSLIGDLRAATKRTYPVRSENLLLTSINLRAVGHAASKEDSSIFLQRLMDRIREVPGVVSVSASTITPLGGMGSTNLRFDGKDPGQEVDQNFVLSSYNSPKFISTIELPILAGRDLDEHDFTEKANVVVVDRVAAHRYWPNQNPIGKVVQSWVDGPRWVVIGVCEHLPNRSEDRPTSQIFLPFYVAGRIFYTLEVSVVRDSALSRAEIAAAMKTLLPSHTSPEIRSIEDQISSNLDDLTATAQITLWVAGFATVITALGFYFFSAYTVSRNLKDAAIRLALGAMPRDILRIHLFRFKWGVLGGLVLGMLMLLAVDTLWGRLVSKIAAPPMTSLFVAVLPIVVVAGLGLCLPLRKVRAITSYHLLRSDME